MLHLCHPLATKRGIKNQQTMKIEPFKMEVTPEQSRQVQEIVFRNGGRWNSGLDTVQYEDSPFLYFEDGILVRDDEDDRDHFEDPRLPLITFADFMARYGGAQTTQFDIMRKIVTIAEEAHENGETGLCSILLLSLADYIVITARNKGIKPTKK